jgi:hypothetical protein
MFLNKEYILANELVQKMDIHIANISMLKQKIENQANFDDIIKMNNCTFVNRRSKYLPNNIKIGILTNTFTDLSNKLPVTYIRSEFGVSEKELFAADIVEGKIKIADKEFYVFKNDFIDKVKNGIINILDKEDKEDCEYQGSIDGSIKLSKNKYLTWYNVW